MVTRVDWQPRTQLWSGVLDVLSERILANLWNAIVKFMEMKCKKIPRSSEKRLKLPLFGKYILYLRQMHVNKDCKPETMK